MTDIQNHNLNILYKINGDKKFGKRIILLLVCFIITFLVFYGIIRLFPKKYYEEKIQNNVFNKNIIPYTSNKLVFYRFYKNLEQYHTLYFILKINLNSGKRGNNSFSYLNQTSGNDLFNLIFYIKLKQSNSPITNKNIDLSNYKNEFIHKGIKEFNCKSNHCEDNHLFYLNNFKYKNLYFEIDFNYLSYLGLDIKNIEVKTLIFNPDYKIPYSIFRSILIVLGTVFYIRFILNIKKVSKKFHSFEHKHLKYIGIVLILYNDPFFLIKLYINSYIYIIIYSIELVLFITIFLYFNLIIAIRMNYYDNVLNYGFNWKLLIIFIPFFCITLANLISLETSVYKTFSIYNKIGIPSLKIVNFVFFILIFISIIINFFMILFKFKLKTNRTKGLIFFSLLFNFFFLGNIFTNFYFYNDPINTEILFYMMVNMYFIFLFHFFRINLNKINKLKIESSNNTDNIIIMTKEINLNNEYENISLDKNNDKINNEQLDKENRENNNNILELEPKAFDSNKLNSKNI